jgi:hypothetical protein
MTYEPRTPRVPKPLEIVVRELSESLTGARRTEVDLTSMTIRGPIEPGQEILMVLKGFDHAGAPVVAFHSAYSLGECLQGLAGRINNGTLRWKEDEYR